MSKKALFIIAFEGYRDEEYDEPKEVLENAGIEVTAASTQVGTAHGKLGGQAKVDIVLSGVNASDYNAIVFIGGPGSHNLFQDKNCHKIARDAAVQDRILAAICAAPGILAYAGVLNGKKATCFESEAQLLKNKGAEYTGDDVEVDGKLITANGPQSAKKFGQAILKALRS